MSGPCVDNSTPYCMHRRNNRTNRLRAQSGSPSPSGSSAGPGSHRSTTIPIFPLGTVALPGANVPLQIFEARYRVLFSTLLDGSSGIDEGLVSPDKPWRGTRRFGMSLFDSNAGGLATVGTVLEITEHSMVEDGRILIQTIGRERFKIVDVVEERPVLVCKVEYLEEDGDDGAEAQAVASKVGELFRDMVKLTVKLRDTPLPDEVTEPAQLQSLDPRGLSFWVASLFGGNPYNQQALLEEESTLKRLKLEEELLSSTLKYLSAQAALQSAFKSGGDDTTPSDRPLGPD